MPDIAGGKPGGILVAIALGDRD